MSGLQKKIEEIENKINRMIEVIGTKAEAEDLEKELEQERKQKNPTQEDDEKNQIKLQKPTISHVINLMKNTKHSLLENNEELRSYFNEMQKNKYMIDNFCNYANTALNIRDKARLIIHIREDLEQMNRNVNQLENFEKNLEAIRNLGDIANKNISDEKIFKLKSLIEKADKQKNEINQILEVYREMVEFMNEKLIEKYLNKKN